MSKRQTTRFLMERFEETGLRPERRLGQNFLTDLNLVELLADTAELSPRDVVLEVGTGLGSLTSLMAPRVAHVVTVEVDARLQQLAAEELLAFANVTMLRQDALRNKNHIHPAVLEAIRTQLERVPGGVFKLAANLPYHIATPLISNLLQLPDAPRSMTVTIQKEVADRVVASPGTKDYGAFSIWAQCQCRARIVRVMPPSVFWPRPKVDSAIVHIELDDELRRRLPDREFFHQFVRSMFFHRRKFIRAVLCSAVRDKLSKTDVDAILAELGIENSIRAETLNVAEMIALSERVRSVLPSS